MINVVSVSSAVLELAQRLVRAAPLSELLVGSALIDPAALHEDSVGDLFFGDPNTGGGFVRGVGGRRERKVAPTHHPMTEKSESKKGVPREDMLHIKSKKVRTRAPCANKAC